MTATKTPRASRAKTPATTPSMEDTMPLNTEPTDLALAEPTDLALAEPTLSLGLNLAKIVVNAPKVRVAKPSAVVWSITPRPKADAPADIHRLLGMTAVPSNASAFPNDYDEKRPRYDESNRATVAFTKHANKSMTYYVDFDGEPVEGRMPPMYKHTDYDRVKETRGAVYTLTVHLATALLNLARRVTPDASTRYAVAISWTASTTQNPRNPDAKYTPIVVPYDSRVVDICAVVALAVSEQDPSGLYKTLCTASGISNPPTLSVDLPVTADNPTPSIEI